MAAQEQDRLAVAFHTEVGPRITAMERRVAELDGWIDEKQATWNRLLEELFEAFVVHLVLIDVNSEVPIDDIEEDLLELVELLNVHESALGREELVGVKDIRVELLCDQSRCKY